MKKSIIFASVLTMLFCACEKKDDLWSNANGRGETGALALGVSAHEPEALTRAEGTVVTDFPVKIQGLGAVESEVYEYATSAEVPERLALPVGNYVASAHTPGELTRQMDHPYYYGEKEITILKEITSKDTVECKMANSKIAIALGDGFADTYSSWTITINDGGTQALEYTETSDNTKPTYWWFGEGGAKEITVDIRATTKSGNVEVYAQSTYTKEDSEEGYTDIENENFDGGDAITVTFTPAKAPNGTITGIDISTNIVFDNYDETVQIELKDKATEPIRISYAPDQNVQYSIGDDYPAVNVHFDFEKGLKSLLVYINSDNADFQAACDAMGISGMDLTSEDAEDLEAIFSLPKTGDSAYDFEMGETIWDMLSAYGKGVHTFTLTATDNAGNTMDGKLTVTVSQTSTGNPIAITYTPGQSVGYNVGDDYPAINIHFDFANGLKSLVVYINSDNEDFQTACDDMNINGMDLTSEDAADLEAIFSLPKANDTDYDFEGKTIWMLLSAYGKGVHTFTLTATDNAGNTKDGVLTITVNE